MINDLLSMEDLDAEQITRILDTAESLKDIALRPIKKVPTLRGRTVCNLFFEDSTRTRISFEIAAKRLSADVINFSADAKSSVAKGESFKDTAWTLEAMGVDAIVVRRGQERELLRCDPTCALEVGWTCAVPGIRCGLCWNVETAKLNRLHNDGNVLSLGERMIPLDEPTVMLIDRIVWRDGWPRVEGNGPSTGPRRAPAVECA